MSWIKCSERMPELDVPALLSFRVRDWSEPSAPIFKRGVALATLNRERRWSAVGFSGYEWEWDFSNDDVTHWQPLPEPPQ